MAYSNATFYVNLQSGSDAARVALTSCVASNPSGNLVRITKISHGLLSGAVVDLTGFDSVLNGSWKVSVYDADNFDLVDAIWFASITGTVGTVTPRGGSSWTDGWATITGGATAARVQQGDSIRISKTPDPVSIGSAAWTSLSRTITLPSAQTFTIDNCESGWAGPTVSHQATPRKQGTSSISLYRNPWLANLLAAYKNLGTSLDLSAYNAITFWHRANTTFGGYTGSAIVWRVCLCSDTVGTAVVDEFLVPPFPLTNGTSCWIPMTLTRTGGGNLGSAIQSIAIYSYTTTPQSSQTVGSYYFDNFSACSSTGLNLNCLISKNGAAYGGSESWHPIQSIDGTNVQIDNSVETAQGSGKGYFGTSETVASYIRSTYKTPYAGSSTTQVIYSNKNGSRDYPIAYSGGWNTTTNLQDGDTFFDGSNSLGLGLGFNQTNYCNFERMSLIRYYSGLAFYAGSNTVAGNSAICTNLVGNVYGAIIANDRGSVITCENVNNNDYGVTFNQTTLFNFTPSASPRIVKVGNLNNNTQVGFFLDGSSNVNLDVNNQTLSASNAHNNNYAAYLNYANNNTLTLKSASNNSTAVVYSNFGINYLRNSNLSGTEFVGATAYSDCRVFSTNHDGTTYGWVYTDGGTMNSQATTFVPGTGAEWRLNVNSSTRNLAYPMKLSAAQYAVNSGTIEVIATMKKSAATDVRGRLVIPGGQLLGVENDVIVTLADNTNIQALTASCTPIQSGVLGVEVWAEYVNNTGIVFVEEIRCQAV